MLAVFKRIKCRNHVAKL